MADTTPNLLPCPFCGGDPELVDSRVEWFVRCNHCKPFATVRYGESVREEIDHDGVDESTIDWGAIRQSAIDAWNRRVDQPAELAKVSRNSEEAPQGPEQKP